MAATVALKEVTCSVLFVGLTTLPGERKQAFEAEYWGGKQCVERKEDSMEERKQHYIDTGDRSARRCEERHRELGRVGGGRRREERQQWQSRERF
ncbi:hypothetical protein NDU88_000891 [Pleurodeles waltl]|uniref:MHC class I antigen n=1 Tax=Pleurodeles waltl TaxID=8319 RepID=A0AAV7Q4F4_PLEWA|nr:hypothetical protein NDU88_000891 [Pleurodeles waltl]